MKRECTLLAAVLVAACSSAHAQDGEGKKEDSAPPARSRDDLLRDVFGRAREARRDACRAAIGRKVLTEDDWLKVLDFRFPTADEDEEARSFAARALAGIGTRRSFARLRKLLDQEPTVIIEGRDEHGGPTKLARHDYQFWASHACHRLTYEMTLEVVDSRLLGLSPKEQADLLALWYVENERSYRRVKPEEAPESVPYWWRSGLVIRLSRLGAPGAFGIARRLAKTEDAAARGRLCYEMATAFRALREQKDRQVEEAGVAALRAVLEGTPSDTLEEYAFLLPGSKLKDAEEEIIAFIRKRGAAPEARKDAFLGAAFIRLAECRTDRALDFIVGWDGPRGEMPFLLYEGFGSGPESVCPELLAPRYVAALAKEDPTAARFGGLANSLRFCVGRLVPHSGEPLHAEIPPAESPGKPWRDIADWRRTFGWLADSVARTLERTKKALADNKDPPSRLYDYGESPARTGLKSSIADLDTALGWLRQALADEEGRK